MCPPGVFGLLGFIITHNKHTVDALLKLDVKFARNRPRIHYVPPPPTRMLSEWYCNFYELLFCQNGNHTELLISVNISGIPEVTVNKQ
jgi:hypothetical protein